MARANKDRYNLKTSIIRQHTGKSAINTIESTIDKIEEEILNAEYALFDGEKVDAIDSLVKEFAEGFLTVIKDYDLKDDTYLPDFVNDYLSIIECGLDKDLEGIVFGGFYDKKEKIPILIDIVPLEEPFENAVECYEAAIRNKIFPRSEDTIDKNKIHIPKIFYVDFEYNPPDDDEGFKESWSIILKIKL